jgi:DNA-binding NarL/FixJ family response regulator
MTGTATIDREVRVLIADDHPIFRRGLRGIIETAPTLKVVAEASDGEHALQCLLRGEADIGVLDVTMPVKDGFAVARAIREQQLAVPLVLLTMHKDEHYLNAALDLGVNGYVLKDSATTEIIQCIQAVAAGQEYVSPALSSFLIRRGRRAAELTKQKPALAELTPTEPASSS